MAIYEYTARKVGGMVLSGAIEADNHRAAVEKLRHTGFYITSIRRRAETTNFGLWGTSRIGLKDLAVFSQQFATMINAGLPLLRTLTILEEQVRHARLRRILGEVRADVESGSTLSAALSKHPAAFSRLYVNMVKAGEAGGVLADVLRRLAGFLEKDLALRQKVKAATTYPTLLAFAALGALLFMTVVIIPQFATFFRELRGSDASLPTPTQIAIGVSTLIQSFWWVGIALALVLMSVVRRYIRTPAGRAWYDRARLRVPVLGSLNHKIVVARLARTLGTLVGCGIPIMRALEVASAAIDNVAVSRAVDTVRTSVREGESIAVQLAATRMFSSIVVEMVKVGEETGALGNMLAKVADFYDSEVEATINSLTSIVEPALIIGMGVVIGSILLALYLPIFGLATAVR